MRCSNCQTEIITKDLPLCPNCGSTDLIPDDLSDGPIDKPNQCKNCNTKNKATSKFCSQCGASLPYKISPSTVDNRAMTPSDNQNRSTTKCKFPKLKKLVIGSIMIFFLLLSIGVGVFLTSNNILPFGSNNQILSIINQTSPLIQNCTDYIGISYYGVPTPSREKPLLRGTALVWNLETNSLDNSYSKLSSELKATSSDDQITVFFVMDKYDGIEIAPDSHIYPGFVWIAVVYWPSLEPIGKYSVHAGLADISTLKNDEVDSAVAGWIEGLYDPTMTYSREQIEQGMGLFIVGNDIYCMPGSHQESTITMTLKKGQVTVPLEAKIVSAPSSETSLNLTFTLNPIIVKVGEPNTTKLMVDVPKDAAAGYYTIEISPDKTLFPDWASFHDQVNLYLAVNSPMRRPSS